MVEPRAVTSSSPGAPLGPGRELRDAHEQLAATREILVALGRAGADPDQILDTVVARAERLCGADATSLYLRDGEAFRISRVSEGIPREWREHMQQHPVVVNRLSAVGRVAIDRRTQQIADVLSRPGVRPPRPAAARRLPHPAVGAR